MNYKWIRRAALGLAVFMAVTPVTNALLNLDTVNAAETLQSFTLPTGDSADRIPPDKLKKITAADAAAINESMKAYVPSGETLIINNAESYYYYEQLNPTAKQIYDVMLMIAKDPAVEENYGVMMTDMDPNSDEYYYEMLSAYFAMTYDHPELFWLYNASETSIQYCSEVMSMNGIYLVYYSLTEPYLNYETQMKAFNQAVDLFLSDINRNVSDYEIARQIHDKLINLVTYDNDVLADLENSGQNLAHTAYGALVANSEGMPNYAVCDGYSLAYEYLLQQCGIEAVVMAGDAGANAFSAGGHAWNLVKLDGTWYEVDSTWNDSGTLAAQITPDIEGYAYYVEAMNDPEYLDIMEHYLFLVSTDTIQHFIPEDKHVYITNDQMYTLNLLGESVHIRWEDDGTKSPRNADPTVLSLGPVAEFDYN